MFRVVCFGKQHVRYVRQRLLAGLAHFDHADTERPHILYFRSRLQMERECAIELVDLTVRGFVLKFTFWNDMRGSMPEDMD